MLLVVIALGVGYALGRAAPGMHTRWDSWSNWDDVPEHVKEEFRESVSDMRESMNEMFDRFEEDMQ